MFYNNTLWKYIALQQYALEIYCVTTIRFGNILHILYIMLKCDANEAN